MYMTEKSVRHHISIFRPYRAPSCRFNRHLLTDIWSKPIGRSVPKRCHTLHHCLIFRTRLIYRDVFTCDFYDQSLPRSPSHTLSFRPIVHQPYPPTRLEPNASVQVPRVCLLHQAEVASTLGLLCNNLTIANVPECVLDQLVRTASKIEFRLPSRYQCGSKIPCSTESGRCAMSPDQNNAKETRDTGSANQDAQR